MKALVYLSSASYPYTDGDLATLLMNSRTNNRELGLTGLLLYKDGQIMQLLEGPEEAVLAKYAVIAADPRHKRVKKLAEYDLELRMFPRWSMGYQPVTDTLAHIIPGFDDFFRAGGEPIDLPASAGRARWLLEWFRDHDAAALESVTP